MWRSPVAYSSGGRVVAGSNPVIPTTITQPALAGFFVSQEIQARLRLNGEIKKLKSHVTGLSDG